MEPGTAPSEPPPGPAPVTELLERHPAHRAALGDAAGVELTYGGLTELTHRLRGQLAAAGATGRTVSWALPNGLPAACLYLAAIGVGAAAPLDPRSTHAELAARLAALERPVVVLGDGQRSDWVGGDDREVLELTGAGTALTLRHRGRELPVAEVPSRSADDAALVLLTSGTTGTPKRVSLLHRHLSHALSQIVSTLELGDDDVALSLMPLFHIHGLQAGLVAPLVAGGRVVVPGPFNALAVPRLCADERVSWYSAVPTMHGLILDRAGERSFGSQLRLLRSSSSPMPATLHTALEQVLSVPVIESYGMTECAHQVASNPLPPGERRIGTVGRPTGVEVQVVPAPETSPGCGEVLVRGPSVISGYDGSGQAAQAASDGWFRTGDEGRLDEAGHLVLTSRIRELINRGGEKVQPLEVEAVLRAHPAVRSAVVFAVPHPRLGEEVAAAIVPIGDAPPTRELRDHVRLHLAPFKVPRTITVTDEIPTGPTGKVQRRLLAELLGLT